VARVVAGAGFAEDAAVKGYDCVSSEDDGRAEGSSGGEFGFGFGETLDVIARRFAGERGFIDGGGHYDEGEAGVVEDFGAARRCGSED